MQYIGTNENCRPYIDLLASQQLTEESSQVLKATPMVLKSRKMKKLRNFQKRKYGTLSSVLGIHGKRKDLLAKELTSYLMPNELAVRGETDENDRVYEVAETINETDLFTVGEFTLFQGTDGLDFNILRITKPVKRKKLGPRTKITGNVLTEQDDRDNGNRVLRKIRSGRVDQ